MSSGTGKKGGKREAETDYATESNSPVQQQFFETRREKGGGGSMEGGGGRKNKPTNWAGCKIWGFHSLISIGK